MSEMTDMDGWMRDVADAAASLDKRGDRQMSARLMRLHRDMDIARLRGEAAPENVAEDSYHFMADLLAPHVTDTHGGLPGSVVESFQMLLEHWNRTHTAQGEQQAVAWQYRFKHKLSNGGYRRWREGDKEYVESLPASSYEWRPLYTRPHPVAVPDAVRAQSVVALLTQAIAALSAAPAAPAPVAGDAVAKQIAAWLESADGSETSARLAAQILGGFGTVILATLAQDRASQGAAAGVPDAPPTPQVTDAMAETVGSALFKYWNDVNEECRGKYRERVRAALEQALKGT